MTEIRAARIAAPLLFLSGLALFLLANYSIRPTAWTAIELIAGLICISASIYLAAFATRLTEP